MGIIDMRTVVLSYVVSNGICAVVIGSLWLQSRRLFSGLGFWFACFVLQFLAFFLIALRGIVPDFVSATVSNAMIVGGTMLLYIGLEQFIGKPSKQVHNVILLAVFIPVHAYFLLISPNLNIRQIILSLGLLAVYSQCAWLMLYRVNKDMRSITRTLGFICIAFSLVSVIRIFLDLVLPASDDFFHVNSFETSLVMAYQMLFIILTLGLFLMVNRRLLVDLKHDIVEHKRMAELLGLSEEKFAKAFQASPDGIVLAEYESGKLVEINDGFAKLFGYRREEVLAHTLLGLNLYADPTDGQKFIGLLREHGRIQGEEFRVRTKDNRERIMLVFAELIKVNEVLHIVCINRDITERKQAEEALRESEEKFRRLAELTPNGLLIHMGGTIVFSNTAAANLLGLAKPEEMLGRKLMDFVHPDYRGVVTNRVRQVTENKNDVPIIEEKLIRLDGIVIDAEVTAIPFVFNGENAVQVVFRDISERKQAENALYESQEQLSKIFQNSPSAVNIFRLSDGRAIDVNDAYLEMTGYSRTEILDHIAAEINLFVDLNERNDWVKKLREGKTVRNQDARIRRKSGEIRDILISFDLFEIKGESVVMAIASDITERKHLEQKLKESEHRLRTIIENAPIAITIGREGKLLYANPRYAQMHGFTNAEDLIGQSTTERVAPQSRAEAITRLHQRSKGLLVDAQYEYFGLRKDGSEFPVIASVHRVEMEDGAANIGFFQDITEFKQIEEKEQEQRALAEVLRDTAEALNSSLRLDDILEKILDYVERVIRYDAMTITWIQDDQIRVVRSRGYAPKQEKFIYEQTIDLNELSAFTQVIESCQPLVIPDVRLYLYWKSSPFTEWIRSHIKAPIIVSEKIVGVINLSSRTTNFFNTDHAKILQTFANQVAIAVQNATLYEEVQHLAIVDELTGIYNRRGFFEMCRREVARLERFGRSFSVLFMDIDHFKQFNDHYSYETGDRVLRAVAESLRHNAREIDLVGRYGGEEMIVLLPEIHQSAAVEIAERLRKTIESLRVPIGNEQLKITISIGIATLTPIQGPTLAIDADGQEKILSNLIAQAGDALHVAKQRGRNQVVAFREEHR